MLSASIETIYHQVVNKRYNWRMIIPDIYQAFEFFSLNGARILHMGSLQVIQSGKLKATNLPEI